MRASGGGFDKKMAQVLLKYQSWEWCQAQSVFLLKCRIVWWCVLCELMCKQPLMIKLYLSTIIAESAVFYYWNLRTCLIKFRVILCQQVGSRVRITVISQSKDTCRLWYCSYLQILGKFAKMVFLLWGYFEILQASLLWNKQWGMWEVKIVHSGNFYLLF